MFVEDLTPFFNSAEFAVLATLPGGEVVQVLFDRPYAESFDGQTSGYSPRAIGRTEDLAALVYESVVVIDGQSWTVTSTQPDGHGVTTLKLREA